MLCCSWVGNVLGKIRWLWALAYLFCTCWFLVQLTQILPNYFAPTLTHTELREVPLKSLGVFPFDFKVCIRPTVFNETALKHFGYDYSAFYVVGSRKFNDSHYAFGWAGHDNQSMMVTNVSRVLDLAKKDWTKSKLMGEFYISNASQGNHLTSEFVKYTHQSSSITVWAFLVLFNA